MGITVIGGLILSTMLTLVIVPASFSLAIGFEERLGADDSAGGSPPAARTRARPCPQAAE